jgi:polyvinyl alcohol dehydrogenase (cytochrome)
VVASLALVAVSAACTSDDHGSSKTPAASGKVVAATDPKFCIWPTAGGSPRRWHATACKDSIHVSNVSKLHSDWFFPTRAEVTGAPAVDDMALYFGDWSGRVYAVDRKTGGQLWTHDIDVQPNASVGQITASPSLGLIAGRPVVVVGGGRSIDVLDRSTGQLIWHHGIGDPANPKDPTEIQGSPVLTSGRVIVAYDVNHDPSARSGVLSLDLATGTTTWSWDPEATLPSGGCGDIRAAPAVDDVNDHVVVGTGHCPNAASWNQFSEAIVSLDPATGKPQWSFQPHEKGSHQSGDFGGAPNLYSIGGRDVVGMGNEDGWYYVVDRATGKLVWKAHAQTVPPDHGSSPAGWVGAASVSTGVVAGGTAGSDCPCVIGIAAATGKDLWSNGKPPATDASSGATTDLLFVTGLDKTLRAFRLTDGKQIWSSPVEAVSASGPAIAGPDLYLGVGTRRAGEGATSTTSGVQAFAVSGAPVASSSPTTTTG